MVVPYILIAIAIGIIGLAIVAYKRKDKKHEIDYRNYYTMGLTWFPIGIIFLIIFKNPLFFILGLVYLAIGLKNKDKWGKKRKLTEKEEKIMKIAIYGLLIFLIFGLAVLSLVK